MAETYMRTVHVGGLTGFSFVLPLYRRKESPMKRVAVCLLLGGCMYAQNVVTDWAGIVQPIINTPAKTPAVLFYYRATIQIDV
jgi:hypothetical protein